MTHETAVLLLAIALGEAFSRSLSRRIGVPAAVVEVLFGVLLAVLGVQGDDSGPLVRFLADVGFALFLFLAGLAVDVRALRDQGVRGLLGPVAIALGAFAMALLVSAMVGWPPWVALALGATSVPVLLSIVRESGIAASPAGRAMVSLAAVGEIVTIGLVAMAEVLATAHGALTALEGVFQLGGLLALVGIGLRALGVLRRWFPERVQGPIGGGDPSEGGILAGFGLTLAMIAAAMLAGAEPLLGAFVGGLLVSFVVDDKHSLEEKFAPMAYGFFVPVFFVDIGMRLDVHALADVGLLPQVLGVCAGMLLVKVLPGLGGLVVGRPPRQVLATSLLLAAPVTLVIAIANLAGRLGVIDGATEVVLVAAAMLASLVFPTLAKRLLAG